MNKCIYPYKKSDGFVRPCRKGCPNCKHCTDVFWDYTYGIYDCRCELHYEHGGCCDDYVNDGTEPITEEEFNAIKKSENRLIKTIEEE